MPLGCHRLIRFNRQIFDSKTEISHIAAGRLVRWSLILKQYVYELKIRSTKDYCNADMLSRLSTSVKSELPTDNMIITSSEIRTETLNDKTLVNVLSHLQIGKWPDKISDDNKPYHNKRNELTIEDEIILRELRVTVPEKLEIKC